jgi:hypothetical protein
MSTRSGVAAKYPRIPDPFAFRRAAEVFELRSHRPRPSWQSIADQIGCSKTTVINAYNIGATQLLKQHGAEADVAQMLHDMDEMIDGLMPKAREGDEKAVQAVITVYARWCRLKGYDQPVKMDIKGQIKVVTVDGLTEAIREAEAKLADNPVSIGADHPG